MAKSTYQQDFETLSKAIRKEAEERGWCSDYEEFIGQVNRHLHHPVPSRAYTSCVMVRFIPEGKTNRRDLHVCGVEIANNEMTPAGRREVLSQLKAHGHGKPTDLRLVDTY